jgi:hypothetical protein
MNGSCKGRGRAIGGRIALGTCGCVEDEEDDDCGGYSGWCTVAGSVAGVQWLVQWLVYRVPGVPPQCTGVGGGWWGGRVRKACSACPVPQVMCISQCSRMPVASCFTSGHREKRGHSPSPCQRQVPTANYLHLQHCSVDAVSVLAQWKPSS